MTKRSRQLLLIGWALVFSALVGMELPDTPRGKATLAATIWMGFFPFAVAVGLSGARYWAMLVLFVGGTFALSYLSLPTNVGAGITAAILGVALAGYGWQRLTARRRQRGQS